MIETVFLTLVFFLINIRSFIFWSLYPETAAFPGEAWREVFIWLAALIMMFYLLKQQNLIGTYFSTWLKEPILIGFILFSLASVFWATSWTVTLHRSLVFAFASMAAVFLGLRYSIRGFLQALFWCGAVIAAASFLLVFLAPTLGTDLSPIYGGAWRGVFWHKNQLGNILPIFNLAFLVLFFSWKPGEASGRKQLAAVFYFLSLVEILFAKSASGYILVFLLHLALGLAFIWLKLRHLFRPRHYYMALVIFLLAVAGALLNLDFIFGLVGRETNLTGRIPMWGVLFREVFPLHPWFGQGFGSIWANLDFRLYMRDLVGWLYPVMIGDNGFIDILLNLGVVGLALFLLYYAKAWINSVRYFLQEINLEGFFPFIFMIYTFFANLTFSLFMETEVFVWTVMVALMIIVARKRDEIQNSLSI